ncbi:tetratricopeptide repeat protein [Methyloferula stellata]|uniref:tetratricopeptide repeat protein n=1 Tax=Methyloferula stellata TaxID=876270 RepID=UPI00035E83B0|nr:tetratricopeptide repeat protein [Methyloferula stellata]
MRPFRALLLLGACVVIGLHLPMPRAAAQGLGATPAAPTLPSTIGGPAWSAGQTTSSPPQGKPDLAFGAFQRGYYLTAMREATKRVDANPNDGAAMTLIAEIYAQGLGVRADPVEAARWLKLGADHGDRQATFGLGLAKLNGNGVPKDRDGARQLFLKAAAENHPGALYNLGVMALENNGVVSDFPKAARYFKQAADLGDPDAAYGLGILYRNGTGVEKNLSRAAEWIGRSADEGDIPAQVEYAIILFNGTGVEKDETAAAKLFLKAAAHNNPVAQNRIARLLAAGRGIKQNMVEAMKWHLLARTAGINDAWLDSKLDQLSQEDKGAVAVAIHQYVGN